MRESFHTTPTNDSTERLIRVADYIDTHFDEALSLETLASLAHFSKFHFHRLFRDHFGETVHERLIRVRMERAASMLARDPELPVGLIAERCGFSSSQNFARAFKSHFGVSPTMARRNSGRRKAGKADATMAMDENKPPCNVDVKTLQPRRVAYIRNIGLEVSQATQRAFERLMQWAMTGRMIQSLSVSAIAAGWSDIATTPKTERMIDACLPVGENITGDGDIRIQTLPGGDYAVVHCEGGKKGISRAWLYLLSHWFPENGHQRDERPVYFIYYNNPHMNPRKLGIMDLCVPVRPL